MNILQPRKWNIPAGVALAGWLSLGSAASAALVVTTDHQQSSATVFSPSWTPDSAHSLINGLAPSSTTGDFNQESFAGNRDVNSLTMARAGWLDIAVYAPVSSTTTTNNYVSCGGNGGNTIVYALPSPGTYGYNLTNIAVYGGWGDSGRDAVRCNVSYATVSDLNTFIPLSFVNYNPANSGKSANRVIFSDSTGAFIAPNVAAVRFDFTSPAAENGWAGVGAITIGGTAATGLTNLPLAITYSNNLPGPTTPPVWTIENDSLIAGMSPSATGSGNFASESSTGLSALTDGAFGNVDSQTSYATCGNSAGTSVTYTLTNSVNGSDITNIVVYSGWGDNGRDGQFYTVSYSTVAQPTTYVPITTIFYNPIVGGSTPSANRVQIHRANGGPLAQQVYNIKFDFTPQQGNVDNGYSGYAELIVEGQNSASPPPPPSPYLTQDTLPAYAETVVGDQVIFTAAFSNVPPAKLQWQVINTNSTATNDISGATNATLTLNNVQLTDSGSYRLKAVNATNGAAAPSYSAAAPLAVGNLPAPVNNVIVKYAGQCGLGAVGASTNFYPTWTIDTNNDLILGFPTDGSGNPGTASAGLGNFGLSQANGDPTILADGSLGYISYWPNVGASPALVTCGSSAANPGTSMTYTLITNSAPNGFDLTNITVYGGWGDAGRNEQKYQILYSTVANPAVFNNLLTVDYNPNDPNGAQTATRTTLVPATGVLAQNVYAVEINWGLQGSPPKNGYEGYSEIIINGTASAPKPVLTQDITPLTAEDVVGSALTLTAGFSGATGVQWQKNGTNIPGATTPALTLSNLHLTDTATNGGYRLVATNASGITISRACAVVVDPAPAASGNIVMAFAYQTSDAGSFSPTWDTSQLGFSLIAGQNPPAGGFGTGDFTDPDANPASHDLAGGLPVLTDGSYGTIVTGGPHPAFATCGSSAGQYVIYTLPAFTNGYDVTNIVVAGGWNDNGRDAQWYTVSYSTVGDPGTFIPITVVTNNPTVSDESVIRATITPAAGLLAGNVYAIEIDFTTPAGGENGYSGYSEVAVFGSPSATLSPTPPTIAQPVVSGGNLVLTGSGGTPNRGYSLMSTTNLLTPLANWTVRASGVLDGSGAFSNAIPISATTPASFFRVRMP